MSKINGHMICTITKAYSQLLLHACSHNVFLHIQIEHWLFTIGYSLAFGTVLAKMWRVYQIFSNPKLNKKVSHVHAEVYDQE